MSWTETLKLSGAFAVPLVAVAALFYGIMSASLGSVNAELVGINAEVRSLHQAVHALHLRPARLEARIPGRNSSAAFFALAKWW